MCEEEEVFPTSEEVQLIRLNKIRQRINWMTGSRRFPAGKYLRYTHPSIGNHQLLDCISKRLCSNLTEVPLQMQLNPTFMRVKVDDILFDD